MWLKSRTTVLAMRSRTMDGIGALFWSWTYLERCEKIYEKSVTAGRIVRDELSGSHLRLLHLHRDMLDGFRDLHFDAMLAETLKNGVIRHAASSEENDLGERKRRGATLLCSQSMPMTVLSMPT